MTSTTDGEGAVLQRPMRADARRNYERLIAEAAAAFAEHGAEASLDDIAKRAGVGNATLYRHFPSRESLLEAVYRDEIQHLSDLASGGATADPLADLTEWMRTAISRGVIHNGLKGLLAIALRDEGAELSSWCRDTILSAAAVLLARAQRADVIRGDLDALILLRLVNAISIAAEQGGGGAEEMDQLISLMIDGLRTR